MRFGILGPLELWEDGNEVLLGAGRQRALLLALLLHANEVVSTAVAGRRLLAGEGLCVPRGGRQNHPRGPPMRQTRTRTPLLPASTRATNTRLDNIASDPAATGRNPRQRLC